MCCYIQKINLAIVTKQNDIQYGIFCVAILVGGRREHFIAVLLFLNLKAFISSLINSVSECLVYSDSSSVYLYVIVVFSNVSSSVRKIVSVRKDMSGTVYRRTVSECVE